MASIQDIIAKAAEKATKEKSERPVIQVADTEALATSSSSGFSG